MESAGYQLKSELARVCLPAPGRTVPRRLAWANSISLLFLLIGLVGAQTSLPSLRAVPPLEQPVPVIIEPLPPPPAATTDTKETDQQNDDDKPQTPSIQQVTIDTPAINFAVPTQGSLLVAASVAPVPVSTGLRKAAPVKQEPKRIESSGRGGDRPAPDRYPTAASDFGQQGTVTLLLTVDDQGKVLSDEIYESSGYVVLDKNAQEWVKRHWIVPPTDGGHVFLAPIRYKLK